MKYLQITTKNGYVWRVPAEVVARNRAEYYYSVEKNPHAYDDEYDYTMESDYELTDWFTGNMNWEDVEEYATRVTVPEEDKPVIGQDEVEVVNEN